MYMIAEVSQYVAVASFAEAWIEIHALTGGLEPLQSPPSRRRGLKYLSLIKHLLFLPVASFAEAWIEILYSFRILCGDCSRLLRGGVD